ncbi:hypothetical protein D3C81_1207080 [compost metagenome]
MEGQGQAAEHQAGEQGDPLALFQLALGGEDQAVDHQGGADQHGGGAEHSADAQAVSGELEGARLHLVGDEEQDQRDEVDELFHGTRHRQDEGA